MADKQSAKPKKNGDEKSGEDGAGEAPSSLSSLALEAGKKLIPIFVTAGGLLGFVAFAGAVILWTRLEAVEVPPEQAIEVAPQSALVTVGASYLLVLGFFGALAVLGTFLVDRRARPTPGMARALLGLLAFEGIAALIFVDGPSLTATVIDCELLVLPLGAAFLAVGISTFGELTDDLERMKREQCGPEQREGLLRPPDRIERSKFWFVFGPIALIAAAMVAAAILMLCDVPEGWLFWALTTCVGAFIVWIAVLAIDDARVAARCTDERRKRDDRSPTKTTRRGWCLRALKGVTRILAPDRDTPSSEEKSKDGRCPNCGGFHEWPECGPSCDAEDRKICDHKRRSLPRPMRLRLRAGGFALILTAVAIGPIFILFRLGLGEWWVAASVAVAALIVAALWRLSEQVNTRLVWFGVAVFLAVPLFGTLLTVVKNIAHPEVQPLALIRETDSPSESIQGLFVTETSDRVYFANVATEGCSDEVVSQSGRLLSVPKDEVVAMSLGPYQAVETAGESALEMAYALTPSVETGGASVLLPGDAARQKKAEEEEVEASWTDTRLENAGPAVRPYFGSGLELAPDSAEPGEDVTLTMRSPNEKTDGFGPSRDGRNVRIGGVLAHVVKEKSHRIEGAEYIRVEEAGEVRFVALGDEGPYVHTDDGYVLRADEPQTADAARTLFVKLADPQLRLNGDEQEEEEEQDGLFVQVEVNEGVATVKESDREVTLASEQAGDRTRKSITLQLSGGQLYRQAWHENRITFRVPDEARSGVVTVECGQLAGSPLLQVAHDPIARIAVQMRPHRPAVELSSHSTDEDEGDDKESTLRWSVEGSGRGHEKTAEVDLPVRTAPYSIKLTVTDPAGHSDTAELLLLRLPASTFAFDQREPLHPQRLKDARRALRIAARAQRPAAIELDGHADDPGTPAYNLRLSLERDERVRKHLLRKLAVKEKRRRSVPVREIAYGETCQLVPGGGRQPGNRRVDIYVLGPGVTVVPPGGCRPGHIQGSTSSLPAG